MPLYEFIFLAVFLSAGLAGLIFCLNKEVKSNCEFRKRLINHLDHSEALYNSWVTFLLENFDDI